MLMASSSRVCATSFISALVPTATKSGKSIALSGWLRPALSARGGLRDPQPQGPGGGHIDHQFELRRLTAGISRLRPHLGYGLPMSRVRMRMDLVPASRGPRSGLISPLDRSKADKLA